MLLIFEKETSALIKNLKGHDLTCLQNKNRIQKLRNLRIREMA